MRTKLLLPLLLLLFGACSSMQQTGQVRDGVYEKPSGEALASASAMNEPATAQDDYYDPDQAKDYDARDYYDMTYNDPYYYNYGRFGWGVGLGYSTGSPCGGTSWGMGTSWGDPYGYGGYGSPYGGGYPYGGYGCGCNDPYSGYYGDPYYNGYGYYGYGGPCYGCYQPVVVYTNTVVGHRPTFGGGGGGGGTTDGGGGSGTPTFSPINPMSLMSAFPDRSWTGTSDFSARPTRPTTNGIEPMKPGQQPIGSQPSNQHRGGERGNSGWNMIGGSTPSRSGSGDFGSGGGGRTVTSPRPH